MICKSSEDACPNAVLGSNQFGRNTSPWKYHRWDGPRSPSGQKLEPQRPKTCLKDIPGRTSWRWRWRARRGRSLFGDVQVQVQVAVLINRKGNITCLSFSRSRSGRVRAVLPDRVLAPQNQRSRPVLAMCFSAEGAPEGAQWSVGEIGRQSK